MSLVLYPVDPRFAIPEPESFLRLLQELGLVGAPFAPERYLPGNEFLRLISFLGCSPAIALSPEEGGPFCYVQFQPSSSVPKLLYGSNYKAPRCGSCGRVIQDLSPPASGSVVCDHCGTQQALSELDWRRSACVTRSPLTVGGIFESEAIPATALLGKLGDYAGVAWDYCYIRGQL